MATSKGTRSRKRKKAAPHKGKKAAPSSQFLRFPEVKGKTVESVEIDPDVEAVCIVFQDKTMLSFDFDPSLTVYPELSDHKTGDSRREDLQNEDSVTRDPLSGGIGLDAQ